MTQPHRSVSIERCYAIWFGALLLEKGHVVALPNGRPEIHVRTRKGVKTIRLCLRQEPVTLEADVVVGRVDELPDEDLPDVVAAVVEGLHDPDSLAFVPVARTRPSWKADGRDYTVAARDLVDFDRLHAWLAKHGPCS